MQNIIIEKPYEFVPPHRGTWWPSVIQWLDLYGRYLRKEQGVFGCELRNQEKLVQALQEDQGIMICPNHCRTADPLVLGRLFRDVGCHVYAMASWHLFNQDWFTAWAIRKMGGFSVNREGVDRQAINTAIEILDTADRPLVIFPEGAVSRTNDRLHALLDGVAFIARAAAKKRDKRGVSPQVAMLPVAIKYRFLGDLAETIDPVLTEIEERFSWYPQTGMDLLERINKVGRGLLCLKEIEYFGREQSGSFTGRLQGLIDRLLCPLEEEWLGEPSTGEPAVPRVKALRVKMLPDMVNGNVDGEERARRWRQLADMYLAQQVSCYPPDYLISRPTGDRLLETVERYEEDLTDVARVHGHLHVVIDVGDPIQVGPRRERGGGGDPVMSELETRLQGMLDALAAESPIYNDGT